MEIIILNQFLGAQDCLLMRQTPTSDRKDNHSGQESEDATALCVHKSRKEVIHLDGKAENVACCAVILVRTFTPISSGDAAL